MVVGYVLKLIEHELCNGEIKKSNRSHGFQNAMRVLCFSYARLKLITSASNGLNLALDLVTSYLLWLIESIMKTFMIFA